MLIESSTLYEYSPLNFHSTILMNLDLSLDNIVVDKNKPVLINFGGSKDQEVEMTNTLVIPKQQGNTIRKKKH